MRTAIASTALILAYILGQLWDPTNSGSTVAIYLPLAVVLIIAATLERRTVLIVIALTAVALYLLYAHLFSHFRTSTIAVFWLGLVIAQLGAALIVQYAAVDEGPPSLVRIVGAMLAAALAYELFESGGLFLGLWVGAPDTDFSDAWNMVADHITKDPTRWVSAVIGAVPAIVVMWIASRLALRRTP